MQFIRETYGNLASLSFIEIVYLVLVSGLLMGGFVFAGKLPQRWRFIALVILSILILRFVLFGNPIAWAFYNQVLTPTDIGWRERDVMAAVLVEQRDWPSPVESPEYLAVGSSQVGAIFGPGHSQSDRKFLQIFSLAGMGVLDFELYRNRIASFQPHHVILYLSEFDIAREPSFEVARFADVAPTEWPSAWRYLVKKWPMPGARRAFLDVVIAWLFPEYKYSFALRGLVDRILGKRALLAIPEAEQIPKSVYLPQQLANLERNLVAEPIPYNISLLSDFLDFCHEQEIKVIVVEGQYNPLGVSPRNAVLHERVYAALQSVTERHHGRFIPRDSVLEFTEADFRDGYHVLPSAGERFRDRLFHLIAPGSGDSGLATHPSN